MKKLLFIIVFTAAVFPAVGQWSDNPEQNNQIIFESMYDWDARILSDGSSIVYYNRSSRTLINQDTVFSIKHVLVRYNADGTPAWDEPLIVANTPNHTFVMVNDHLFINSEDEIYLGVSDCRYDTGDWARMSLTVYKISKDGEQLWGDTGVSIDRQLHGMIAQSNAIALEDASVIIAWEDGYYSSAPSTRTKIARISSQGEVLWNKELSPAGQTAKVVNGGNNEFIIIYMSGSSIQAQKLDFNGERLWGPNVIYDKGGWPSAPMHTNLKVVPVERGAFVSWYADPDANRAEDAYCSYINLNGELLASGTSGLKLGYSGLRQFSPRGVYDPANKCVYYIWSEMNAGQDWSGMKGQKVFLTGEFGWDANAVWVGPYLKRRVGYSDVSIDNEGNPCFFYLEETKSVSDYTGFAQKRTPTGDSLWNTIFTKIVDDEDHIYNKTDLAVLPFVQNQWIALWKDNRPIATSLSGEHFIWGQNILGDGTLGSGIVAIETVKTKTLRPGTSFGATLNPVSDNTSFVVKDMKGEKVEIFISNAMGQKVTTLFNGVIGSNEQQITWNIPAQVSKGVYFATLRSGQRNETVKVIKN
ncbi:MAG: T9SS type A sorting domain-containing protein [Bacteroidales bacterium]|jgi:hypothetical protein|nr:T9SS type A sorting domain-containing protein [Bacteroidales bacterium]